MSGFFRGRYFFLCDLHLRLHRSDISHIGTNNTAIYLSAYINNNSVITATRVESQLVVDFSAYILLLYYYCYYDFNTRASDLHNG